MGGIKDTFDKGKDDIIYAPGPAIHEGNDDVEEDTLHMWVGWAIYNHWRGKIIEARGMRIVANMADSSWS